MDRLPAVVPSLFFGFLMTTWCACGSSASTPDQDAGTGGSTAGGGNGGSAGAATGGGGAGSVMSGTGGTGGSGGPADVPCTAGTVQFHVSATSGSDYCAYPPCGSPGVGANVLVSVKSASGQSMPLSGGCEMSCDCVFHACACPAPQRLGSLGQTLTWDGTYLQAGTCGPGGGVAIGCDKKQCAAPGKYTATICAYAAATDAGANSCPVAVGPAVPTCIDLPFDYPSTTPVETTIGAK
jgi:hypothetical protein